jgi:hypothetical protein
MKEFSRAPRASHSNSVTINDVAGPLDAAIAFFELLSDGRLASRKLAALSGGAYREGDRRWIPFRLSSALQGSRR